MRHTPRGGSGKRLTACWTLLVYIAGDNDLDDAGIYDLKELLLAGASSDVHVVVQFDRYGPKAPAKRYVIPSRPGVPLNRVVPVIIGETNTGDPKVLAEFLAWGRKTYPATRLGLVVWNHGGGWRPLTLDKAARTTRLALPDRRLFTPDGPQRALGTLVRHHHALFLHPRALAQDIRRALSKYIAVDESSRSDSLDTIELEKAVRAGLSRRGHLDLLGFDACLMAQLEVAYQLREHVHVFVGSEQTEPGFGWPYTRVLKALIGNPNITPKDFGVAIAKAYMASLANALFLENDTLSVLLAPRLDELAAATGRLGLALVPVLAKDPDPVLVVTSTVQTYDDPHYADLGHFAARCARKIAHPAVQAAAAAVRAARRRAVAANLTIGTGVGGSTGLTVYLPQTPRELAANRDRYALLAFAKDHPGWLDFLDALHAARRRAWSARR